jgi:hypothetical protein
MDTPTEFIRVIPLDQTIHDLGRRVAVDIHAASGSGQIVADGATTDPRGAGRNVIATEQTNSTATPAGLVIAKRRTADHHGRVVPLDSSPIAGNDAVIDARSGIIDLNAEPGSSRDRHTLESTLPTPMDQPESNRVEHSGRVSAVQHRCADHQ